MNFHKRASDPARSGELSAPGVVLHGDRVWPAPPGTPDELVLVELARWEWRSTASTDPWVEVEGFLAGQSDVGHLVGFGVLLGHGAALRALEAGSGWGPRALEHVGSPAATPAPTIPEVVVVAYREASAAEREGLGREPSGSGIDPSGWVSTWSEQAHAEAVECVRRAIGAGEVYQVNLVSHQHAELPRGAEQAHEAGWALQQLGAAWAGSLVGDGWSVHSASPELAIRLRDGGLSTEPIKGTLRLAEGGQAGLLASTKDRAEHVMIVDLERNDLSQVAATGSVSVPELYAIHAWTGLAHAHSTVQARLDPQRGLADVLRALLPGGSVTGAPKSSALRLLHELEPVGRGPSMGAMGWITPGPGGWDTWQVELALTIRTVACEHGSAGTPGTAHLWAGGGITWGSTPEGEVAEAAAKAAPVIEALAGE